MKKIVLILLMIGLVALLAGVAFADVPEPPQMVDLRYGNTTTVSCEGGMAPLLVVDGVGESVILTCIAQVRDGKRP